MRWYHFSLIYLLAAVALVWFPAAMAAPDTVTFHRFSMSGPVVTSFNDGETVYVNASDGVSSGGSVNYIVIDGNGTYHNLTLWDNGNQADETPHDGYYAGRFTIYETRVPGVPFPKIQYNNSSNGTVIVDLDLGGDGTVANFTASYSNFTLYLVRVISFSPYIYFDNVTDTLYFSNDQNMSDNLTVVLRDNKPGAWGKECTGETAFGSTPTDTDYSDRQWDLNYTVDTNETCNSKIMFTVQDRAGYRAYYNLTVVLDNDGPTVDSLAISTFPDYIGPTYRWWRPQGLIWGLNVTWNNVDTGAGLGGGALDWNATVDAYDQFGIDCGADGHENVGGLDDDGSCRIDITVTIRDHVNNTGSDTYSIMFDADAPNITVLNVTENSDNIYYNGTLLYSNDQIMADPFEFVIFDDENGSGRRNASGSSAFGDTPSDNDYTGGWNLQYIVHTGETSGPISLYVFDNVGNMATTVVPTVLDNNDPLIDGDVTEDSPYLHLDGILYFGDDMTGVENATFSGGARDDIGLWKIEFSQEPNLASSPATPILLNGTVDFWNASYGFDSSSTPGDGWIVI
ncbi:MAG TPA: hypothetical protein EYP43_01115, partial [Thermoplasmata archaeon]|nr:hypothetical protein [Thermoplasmata archaeon]